MADRIRDIQSKMTEQLEQGNLIAAISYVPLVGWIYPYLGRAGKTNSVSFIVTKPCS